MNKNASLKQTLTKSAWICFIVFLVLGTAFSLLYLYISSGKLSDIKLPLLLVLLPAFCSFLLDQVVYKVSRFFSKRDSNAKMYLYFFTCYASTVFILLLTGIIIFRGNTHSRFDETFLYLGIIAWLFAFSSVWARILLIGKRDEKIIPAVTVGKDSFHMIYFNKPNTRNIYVTYRSSMQPEYHFDTGEKKNLFFKHAKELELISLKYAGDFLKSGSGIDTARLTGGCYTARVDFYTDESGDPHLLYQLHFVQYGDRAFSRTTVRIVDAENGKSVFSGDSIYDCCSVSCTYKYSNSNGLFTLEEVDGEEIDESPTPPQAAGYRVL